MQLGKHFQHPNPRVACHCHNPRHTSTSHPSWPAPFPRSGRRPPPPHGAGTLTSHSTACVGRDAWQVTTRSRGFRCSIRYDSPTSKPTAVVVCVLPFPLPPSPLTLISCGITYCSAHKCEGGLMALSLADTAMTALHDGT